jgi:hypothetical protein
LESLVHLEKMVFMDVLVHLAQKEKREKLVFRDLQGLEVYQDQKVLKVILEPQDFLVILETKDLQEPRVILVNQVMMESKVIMVHLVIQVQEEILVCKDHLEKLDYLDHLEGKVTQV